ncbi:hypothetical protein QUW47_01855 [Phocaeicola barnesiae]|nr:hypothetical protein [Phocaeicola barnesiae]
MNRVYIGADGDRVLVNFGTIYQFMESVQLIESTSNVDTLKGRIDFVKYLFKLIKNAYGEDRNAYTMAFLKAREMIRRAYPNYYSSYNTASLMSQTDADLYDFYGENVVRCFEDYKEKMIREMSKLKTTPAKQKRIENVKSCYKTCCEILSFDECSIQMENLKKQYEIFLLIYEESN